MQEEVPKQKQKTEEILTATAFAVNFPASRPLRFKPPQNLLSDLPTRTLPFLPKIKQNQSKPDLITKRNHHRKPTSISESKKKKVTCHRFNRCELSSLRRTKQICRRYSRCCSQTLQNHCHFRVQDGSIEIEIEIERDRETWNGIERVWGGIGYM